MFLLRNAILTDIEDLYELSLKVFFLNLPSNRDQLKNLITSSLKSFEDKKVNTKELEKYYYLFVLEDLLRKKVIGCCMIHAQHGTHESPHLSLKINTELATSSSLNISKTYHLLTLEVNRNGPTEVGGLVLSPEYRGHKDRLGKKLSFVRFLYISLYPEKFKDIIHSELMPPLPAKGCPPLWEEFGKKFLGFDYKKADELSRTNKEFIINLFPQNGIYVEMLGAQAQNCIGLVAKETRPVKAMFEKIGFKYINEIDPLDGGPHYQCKKENILPIQNKFKTEIIQSEHHLQNLDKSILISIEHPDYHFASISFHGNFEYESKNRPFLISKLNDNQFEQYWKNKQSPGIII